MGWPFVQARYDYGPRNGPVLGFVVHMAEGGGTVGYLARDPARGVSVHYVIESSGRIVQMLREDHASGSIDPGRIRSTDDADGFYGVTAASAVLAGWARDPNAAVISVELEGFAATGPDPDQATALERLVDDVRSRHPSIGLLGHRDFADYKACPGRLIPWTRLGGHGPKEDIVQAPITDEIEQFVTVAKGAVLYDLDNRTELRSLTAALPARRSPYGVGTRRAIFAETPAGTNERRLVLVAATVVPDPTVQARARAKAEAIAAVQAIP